MFYYKPPRIDRRRSEDVLTERRSYSAAIEACPGVCQLFEIVWFGRAADYGRDARKRVAVEGQERYLRTGLQRGTLLSRSDVLLRTRYLLPDPRLPCWTQAFSRLNRQKQQTSLCMTVPHSYWVKCSLSSGRLSAVHARLSRLT